MLSSSLKITWPLSVTVQNRFALIKGCIENNELYLFLFLLK